MAHTTRTTRTALFTRKDVGLSLTGLALIGAIALMGSSALHSDAQASTHLASALDAPVAATPLNDGACGTRALLTVDPFSGSTTTMARSLCR